MAAFFSKSFREPNTSSKQAGLPYFTIHDPAIHDAQVLASHEQTDVRIHPTLYQIVKRFHWM